MAPPHLAMLLSVWLLLMTACPGCSHAPEPRAAVSDGVQVGLASFYAPKFEGRRTASGERYCGDEYTAAHRTLPFGTRVRVTHVASGRSVECRVNDRGPHRKGRIVDLSHRAAVTLGIVRRGLARVRLEVLDTP